MFRLVIGPHSNKRYWAAPILLDLCNSRNKRVIEDWIQRYTGFNEQNTDPESDGSGLAAESDGRKIHLEQLVEAFENPGSIGLGKIPEDLVEVLAEMCLGSPAIAAYRSLIKYFKKPVIQQRA